MTVVGSSCSIPRPGRACSSYLFEAAGRAVVADLGTGSFSNLLRYRSAESIDAVVISHMHADHFIDVIAMRYALKYGERSHDRRVALYLPPGGDRTLETLVSAFAPESHHDFMGEVFDVRTYDPDDSLAIGDARLRFAPTAHYIPTFAIRCESGSASVTYSADTAPDDAVVALARGASLFLCEATLSPEGEADIPRGHLSARQAGMLAARADVETLVLTHYPIAADVSDLARRARAEFSGDVVVADDGLQLIR